MTDMEYTLDERVIRKPTHDTPEASYPSPGESAGFDAEVAALAAVMRRVGCEVNVDQIAYYLVHEGVRTSAPAPTHDTPEAVAARAAKAEYWAPVIAAMPHDTSEAALAAALAVEFGKAGFFRPGASMEFLTEQARMMLHDALAALPDWTLVPRVATADWTGSTRTYGNGERGVIDLLENGVRCRARVDAYRAEAVAARNAEIAEAVRGLFGEFHPMCAIEDQPTDRKVVSRKAVLEIIAKP